MSLAAVSMRGQTPRSFEVFSGFLGWNLYVSLVKEIGICIHVFLTFQIKPFRRCSLLCNITDLQKDLKKRYTRKFTIEDGQCDTM